MKIRFILTYLIIASPVLPQNNPEWFIQQSSTSQNIEGVFFIDTLNGWAVGQNIILRTTNGGGNWLGGDSPYHWRSLFFTDLLNGIIVGTSGRVHKTTDGGLTFTQKVSGVTGTLTNVYFKNPMVGFVGGEILNKIIMTTDGGENWFFAPYIPGLPIVIRDYFFMDDSVGWSCGLELLGSWPYSIRGIVLKTVDAGFTWNINYQNPMGAAFNNIVFFNERIGSILSTTGKFIYTTNSGISWQTENIPWQLESIARVNEFIGYRVGMFGLLYKTEDSGITWELISTDSSKYYKDIYFVDEEHGWIVGNDGLIMCTKDYSTITSLSTEIKEVEYFLSQNYPNPL